MREFTRRLFLLGVAALLAAPALEARAADPVRIGFSFSKTGIFAPAAVSQLNAYELWREQVNAKGGLDVAGTRRMVEFVYYDDQSDQAQGVKIYEKLITDDKVDLLAAPWGTALHFAIAGVLERYQVPMVGNTAASVKLRELKAGNIWFPTSSIPDRQAVELVKLLQARGVKRAALITNQLVYTQENKQFVVPEARKAGIELVINEDYPPDIKDMTALVTKIKNASPDAVLAFTYPGDAVLYTKAARELGLNAGTQVVLLGPQYDFFGGIFGAAANGLITMGHWTQFRDDWRGAKAYYDAYKAKFGIPTDTLDAPLAYASLEILEQAVAKAGLDRAKLRQTISTETFQTIIGPVRFDGVQNAVTATMLSQIQDQQTHIVWPANQATRDVIAKPNWP